MYSAMPSTTSTKSHRMMIIRNDDDDDDDESTGVSLPNASWHCHSKDGDDDGEGGDMGKIHLLYHPKQRRPSTSTTTSTSSLTLNPSRWNMVVDKDESPMMSLSCHTSLLKRVLLSRDDIPQGEDKKQDVEEEELNGISSFHNRWTDGNKEDCRRSPQYLERHTFHPSHHCATTAAADTVHPPYIPTTTTTFLGHLHHHHDLSSSSSPLPLSSRPLLSPSPTKRKTWDDKVPTIPQRQRSDASLEEKYYHYYHHQHQHHQHRHQHYSSTCSSS
jgi:hypothetical protein